MLVEQERATHETGAHIPRLVRELLPPQQMRSSCCCFAICTASAEVSVTCVTALSSCEGGGGAQRHQMPLSPPAEAIPCFPQGQLDSHQSEFSVLTPFYYVPHPTLVAQQSQGTMGKPMSQDNRRASPVGKACTPWDPVGRTVEDRPDGGLESLGVFVLNRHGARFGST